MRTSLLPLSTGQVDLTAGTVDLDGQVHTLTPREQQVLAFLVARAGQTVSREHLLAEVWADEAAAGRAVDTTIRRLRTKLESDPSDPVHLLTVHGEGYRFVPAAPLQAMTLGDASFDPARRLWRDDRGEVQLTPKEAGVLGVLADADGEPVTREVLQREVWGVRRRAALRYVDYVVHGLRKKIEGVPEHPERLVSVPGVGYCLDRGRPLAPTAPAATNLGAEATSFVGRTAELARVAEVLRDARLVTLTGPGGCGKTRLARRLAQDHLGTAEVWFCDLSACESADEVWGVVARLLGLEQVRGHAFTRALDARGPLLLILDNAEHVVPAVASHVGSWLAATRALRVLVTSRVRLDRVEEVVVELGPLATDDAVALYLDRAAQLRPEPSGSADVATLCARLDGLPLAIELAAARAAVLDPSALLEHLDERFVVLRRGRGGRHGSLWATIAWSWQLLSPAEQATFAQLSVFRGGFDLAAAEAVVEVEGADVPPALDRIEALVQHSLVVTRHEPGGLRFALYESLQQFAAIQLDDHEGSADATERHATWYAERARGLVRRASEGGDIRAEAAIGADHDNLLAAARHLLTDDPSSAAWCLRALNHVARVVGQGTVSALSALTDTCIEALGGTPADPVPLAGLLLDRSVTHLRAGDRVSALADLQRAGTLPHLEEDDRALLMLNEANTLQKLGRFEEATDCLDRATALHATRPTFPARVARLRGMLARGLRDLDASLHHHQQALHLFEALGHPRAIAQQRYNIAMVRVAQVRSPEVIDDLRDLVDLYESLGARFHAASTLNILGCALVEIEELDDAEAILRRALDVAERYGASQLEALIVSNLALVLGDREEHEASLALRRRALAEQRRLDNPRGVLLALLNVGMGAINCGYVDEARTALDEAAPLALDSPGREAMRACLSALHHGLWGSVDDAEAEAHAARDASTASDPKTEALVQAAPWFAELARARAGDDEARARLSGWLAADWPPAERFGQVQWVRELLGEALA